MTAPIIFSDLLVSTKSFDQLIKEWLNKLRSSFYLILYVFLTKTVFGLLFYCD